MATHKITITVPNSAAGIPVDKTGIMGMVLQGVAVASTLVLDTPYLLTKLADATAMGINAAYDVTNGTAVFQQISEFYGSAGDGALLWIQVTAKATAYASYVASAAFSSYVRFSAQADPSQQVKIIGLCYNPPVAVQSSTDFPADVPAAVTAAQTIQQILFQKGFCFSVIVDGYNMSSAVTPATIGTQATNTAFSVSLCITGTKGNGVSAVGLALAKFARISIGRGMGATEDGAINTTAAYLTNGITLAAGATIIVGDVYTVAGGTVTYNAITYQTGQSFLAVGGHTVFTTADTGYVIFGSTPIIGMDPDDLSLLGGKQYMFITTVQGISGLYWNDGATCTAVGNFFSSQEYNRVANSLSFDARAFFTLLRGLNLPSDVQTGALDPVFCQGKQKSFKTKFIDPLSADSGSGDISGGELTVTGPNYNADAKLFFTLRLVRSTILGDVIGTVQFVTTL